MNKLNAITWKASLWRYVNFFELLLSRHLMTVAGFRWSEENRWNVQDMNIRLKYSTFKLQTTQQTWHLHMYQPVFIYVLGIDIDNYICLNYIDKPSSVIQTFQISSQKDYSTDIEFSVWSIIKVYVFNINTKQEMYG